jgi:LssY C-terminus
MRISLKLRLSLLVFCTAALEMFTAAAPTVRPKVARLETLLRGDVQQETQAQKGEAPSDSQDEVENEDLAPAAVEIDVSGDSPLIRALYQATRETKENEILAKLDQAKKLLADGADVKATDSQGRTALHWAVFGSSYNTKTKIIVAYEEIADTLIQRGVEINREDHYQDTALDYLIYSPNFEMQTLLIENGATSGFLVAVNNFYSDAAEPPSSKRTGATAARAPQATRKADLAAGQTLSVRLDAPVYSDRSRTGDPIEATVTYPLCKNGEQVACKEGELIIPPGVKLNGTILFAQKAPNKYSRPRLVLDFSNIVHKNGERSPVYARVLDVDNARETIQNNEILGIVQPHASNKGAIAMAAVSFANPIAGYTIKGAQAVYGLSIRREILFPAGTDVQLQIVRPTIVKQKESWAGWKQLPVDKPLERLATEAPLRTHNKSETMSDPTNLLFLGTQRQVEAAFGEAGWFKPENLGMKSALKAAQATVRQSGYSNAPVSLLLLEGRPPDLVFQKSLDTFAKRHHLRIWKLEKTYNGQEVWIGAATHDVETTKSRAGTKWAHRIDPHVDRERDWVTTDLLFIGTGLAYADVDRPSAPRKLNNATGDEIVTDGKISVVQLARAKDATDDAEVPAPGKRPQENK